MSTRNTGRVSRPRSAEELTNTMQDLAGRAVRCEAALREALTALRTGKHAHALKVLEAYEAERERRAAVHDPRG